jgi:hypothetical protein
MTDTSILSKLDIDSPCTTENRRISSSSHSSGPVYPEPTNSRYRCSERVSLPARTAHISGWARAADCRLRPTARASATAAQLSIPVLSTPAYHHNSYTSRVTYAFRTLPAARPQRHATVSRCITSPTICNPLPRHVSCRPPRSRLRGFHHGRIRCTIPSAISRAS